MTIWSERTQRSIASDFAAASVSGNRTLRSVVPSGRRVPYGVVSVGRRIPYSVAVPMNTATPTPPIDPSTFAEKSKPAVTKPSQLTGHN